MTPWTVIAVVAPWKPRTQGETRTHNPTIRFSHSSQIANAASAAIAENRDHDAGDGSILRDLSAVEAEDPRREEQNRAEDQVCHVAQFCVRPVLHGTLHMAPSTMTPSVEGLLHPIKCKVSAGFPSGRVKFPYQNSMKPANAVFPSRGWEAKGLAVKRNRIRRSARGVGFAAAMQAECRLNSSQAERGSHGQEPHRP